MQVVSFASGVALTVAVALLALATGYRAANRLMPDAATSVRISAASIAALWMLTACFWLLAPLGLFRAPIALGVVLVIALVTRRAWGRLTTLGADWQSGRRVIANLGWVNIPLVVVAAIGLGLTLRSLAAPPLAWDSLTYHLVHSGRYVQAGGLDPLGAPDAWGYFEYLPPGAEIIWSWAMLFSRSAVLVGTAGASAWLVLFIAVYAAARHLGGSERRACLVALIVPASPAFLSIVTNAYVDVFVAAVFAAGVLFVARALADPSRANLLFATAALALGSGAKPTGLPILVLAAVLLCVLLVRKLRSEPRAVGITAVLMLIAVVPGGAHYIRALVETGNPLYPAPLDMFGLAGNTEWILLHASALLPRTSELGLDDLISGLFVGTHIDGGLHRNLGLGVAIILPCAIVGLGLQLRDPRHRGLVLFLVAAVVVNVWLISSDRVRVFRLAWWYVSGRYFAPALVAMALFAVRPGHRAVDALLAASAVVSVAYTFPLGFARIGIVQAALVGICVLVAVTIMRAVRFKVRGALGRCALAVALVFGVALLLHPIRQATRIPTYEAARKGDSFDFHRLAMPYLDAWPAWVKLDSEEDKRIAVTAGWDGIGHNWYLFPLLGSHLQNRLHYVPVTADGSVIDYRTPDVVLPKLDLDAWSARLVDGRFEYLVILPPFRAPEVTYVRQHPERFEPLLGPPTGSGLVFRIRPVAR